MPAHLSVRHAIALLVLLVACSDRSSPGPTGENTTRVLLTDAPFPFDRVERVDLYVVSVSGSLTPDTSAAGSFVTMATPNRTIDLLALQRGVTDELGALELPEGVITAVRLTIDTDLSSITLKDGTVLTGSSTPGIAWQSSAGRPVLNALIHEQIDVPDTRRHGRYRLRCRKGVHHPAGNRPREHGRGLHLFTGPPCGGRDQDRVHCRSRSSPERAR